MSGGQLISSPRRTVATYQTSPEAQRAVDYLSDHHYTLLADQRVADEAARLLEALPR